MSRFHRYSMAGLPLPRRRELFVCISLHVKQLLWYQFIISFKPLKRNLHFCVHIHRHVFYVCSSRSIQYPVVTLLQSIIIQSWHGPFRWLPEEAAVSSLGPRVWPPEPAALRSPHATGSWRDTDSHTLFSYVTVAMILREICVRTTKN